MKRLKNARNSYYTEYQFKQLFREYDTNNSLTLDREELAALVKGLIASSNSK
jgi:Ca2+-binding EF-hand superfamily protein